MIECRRMTEESREDALSLLREFLAADEHYLASSQAYGDRGEVALEQALTLFLERSQLGFVWLAYEGPDVVAVCVVSFAISTSLGGVVAKLDDVFVRPDRRGQGVGAAHLADLKAELRRIEVRRIDTSVHLNNTAAGRFYERHGFCPLAEERLACLL